MPGNFDQNTALLEDTAEKVETIEEIAQINFQQWKDALLSGNAEIVASLYAPDATLLGTVSSKLDKGLDKIQGYFQHFLEQDPNSEIVDEVVQELGPDHYLHLGMYNFKIGPSDAKQTIEARFSFVWKKNDVGDWEILHHHSSIKPEEE